MWRVNHRVACSHRAAKRCRRKVFPQGKEHVGGAVVRTSKEEAEVSLPREEVQGGRIHGL